MATRDLRVFDQVVYFIHAPAAKRVKIGTTTNLDKRLTGIAAQSPVPLKLLGSFVGGIQVERWCHFHCVAERSHFEWFQWNKRTQAFVDMVLAHGDNAAEMLCVRELRADQREAQGRPVGARLGQLPIKQRDGAKARAVVAYLEFESDRVTPLGQCSCARCKPQVEQ